MHKAAGAVLRGLNQRVLSPARIRELILRHEPLEEAARALTDAALAQGSDDNLSALLLAADHLPLETLEET